MSQCSERVKHAVPPPFVSSGLFLLPAPTGIGSRPLCLVAAGARGWGARTGLGRFWAGNGKPRGIRPLALPARPKRHIRMEAGGEAGNIYAATLTLYIASPATDIAGLPPPASYLQFKASAPCPPRIRPCLPDSQRPTPFDHQKHTNWSQIMHGSPQSGRFLHLPCV